MLDYDTFCAGGGDNEAASRGAESVGTGAKFAGTGAECARAESAGRGVESAAREVSESAGEEKPFILEVVTLVAAAETAGDVSSL